MPLFEMRYRDKQVKYSIIEARDQRYAELVAKRWVAQREIPTVLLMVQPHLVASEDVLTAEDLAQIKAEDQDRADRDKRAAEKAATVALERLKSKVQPIKPQPTA